VSRHYLVTGGAGFIGFALVRSLRRDGHRVTVVDRRRLPPLPGVKAIRGDISSRAFLDRLESRRPVDAVLHLAAQTSARISQEKPGLDSDWNSKGTLLLLEWCRRHGVSRFLYASSMAVYGQPEELPVDEMAPVAPVSNYGVSKLAGENYIRAYERQGLLPTIFRLFNVYGPGQDMANLKQGMASIYLAYVLREREVPVTGELSRFRDFIHVDDVIRAWRLALNNEVTVGKLYNLGCGVKTTVRELLDIIIAACGHDPASYPVRQIAGHRGDQFGMLSDSTRFQADTGWKPDTAVADGIERMAQWCRGSQTVPGKEKRT